MFRISKLADYATLVMSSMAQTSDVVYSAQQLAEVNHIETPTASKVLKLLAHAGLVESYRGAHGGYRLAHRPEDISVAQIVRAIEGSIGITECVAEPGSCGQEAVCRLRSNWQRVGSAIEQALESLSLAEMAAPMMDKPMALTIRLNPTAGAKATS
ncbi:MAG: SUF system Fe-S cluster assembly regulator [Wenzhouxiangellaceae bacterium]